MKKLFISISIIAASYTLIYALAPKQKMRIKPTGLNDEFNEPIGFC